MQLTNGTELKRGDYRIIEVLGQGGFGITYLALQVKLNRKVAIKEFFMKDLCNRDKNSSFVSVPSVGSRELVERFKQKFLKEAGLIASFDNANIIRIHDVFEENGTAYYVMEYLEGKSLKRLVDESGALPEDVAVKYIRQVADALKEVHENNLLHLDVKPANIMLDKKGNAVLIDFGISKHYDEAGHQTSSAGVGISEGYAPIEQYEAGALKTFTPVTDIYALGATLFFLLTGTRPPKASYINDEGLPPMPEALSLTVRKAVESAMQPRRKDRPQSVEEFLRLVESGEMKDEICIFGNASSDGSSAASQNVMPLGSQKASVAKDESEETEIASDATSLSMGTGQNAANGNAAVEESEIEVEVVETPSVAPEPAPRPQPEENQKKNKFLWIIILLAVICGAVGGFMLLGGGSDVRKDSAKDTSRLIAQKADTPKQDSILSAEAIHSMSDGLKEKNDSIIKRNTKDFRTIAEHTNNHDYIDLGLPSGILWATCNVGAQKAEEHGNYYAWGETTTKKNYTEKNSTTYRKKMEDISGNPKYDVARKEWGGSWRIPTLEEFEELRYYCKWEWTTKHGIYGYEVISKKNGKSIFLPASFSSEYEDVPLGFYWTSTPDHRWGSVDSRALFLRYNGGRCIQGYAERYSGYCVRPICGPAEHDKKEKTEKMPSKGKINQHEYVDLGLSVVWATCNVGANKAEEYGNYYAWGETTTKESYTRENSLAMNQKIMEISGNAEYDVARKEWGGSWRMPTSIEFEELFDSNNCTWKWVTLNGINGLRVTSKKNGNSIFLPAGGNYYDTELKNKGVSGSYFSSTRWDDDHEVSACEISEKGPGSVLCWLNHGQSVRPVSGGIENKTEKTSNAKPASNKLSTRTFKVKDVEFTMVAVEGGTFSMGSNDGGNDEKPIHQVTLDSYCIGQTEVTQELWQTVMGSNPSYFKGTSNPVENVSYNDCIDFINQLNTLLKDQLPQGRKFRLPTEAEWEFAARGGSKSKGYKYSGSNSISTVAWYDGNSGDKTHPVKQKASNELGLYDMSGNVYEWCSDWKGSYSSSPQNNPKGPSNGKYRVLRGGSWYMVEQSFRPAHRNDSDPGNRLNHFGLRLAF